MIKWLMDKGLTLFGLIVFILILPCWRCWSISICQDRSLFWWNAWG